MSIPRWLIVGPIVTGIAITVIPLALAAEQLAARDIWWDSGRAGDRFSAGHANTPGQGFRPDERGGPPGQGATGDHTEHWQFRPLDPTVQDGKPGGAKQGVPAFRP